MLGDMTLKAAALMELALYARFRESVAPRSSFITLPTAMGLCMVDVAVDTLKYPVAVIEQLAFSLINMGGSGYFQECNLSDACESLKKAGLGICIATPVMALISPLKFIGHLFVTLPNVNRAHPSNSSVEEEARLQWIVYPESEVDVGTYSESLQRES